MNVSSSEFVSVEMGGLKTALIARARAERSSVSTIVRRAVTRELGLTQADVGNASVADSPTVKVSIRFTAEEANLLTQMARGANLGRGAFLVSLMVGGAAGNSGESRVRLLSSLASSNTELATLSNALFQVASLLRQASASAALEYRDTLLGMRRSVMRHLGLATALLAECRPFSRGAVRPGGRTRGSA